MKKLNTLSLALALVMLVSPVAIAENTGETFAAETNESLEIIVSRPVSAEERLFASGAVSDSDLEETRGTFTPMNLTQALGATSNNNVVIGGTTGSNSVSGEAFNNTSGLVNLIQNSGNNVIIQSSTVLNVTLQQ